MNLPQSENDRSRQSRKPRGHGLQGFTLIELLVTLMIMALLFMMLYGILVSSIEARRTVENTLATRQMAQTISNLIAQDLRGTLFYGIDSSYALRGEDSDGDQQPRQPRPRLQAQTYTYMYMLYVCVRRRHRLPSQD